MVTREDIDVYEEDINELVNNIFNGSFMNKYSDVVGSFTADIVRAFFLIAFVVKIIFLGKKLLPQLELLEFMEQVEH